MTAHDHHHALLNGLLVCAAGADHGHHQDHALRR
jgi:hypothetical protein